MKHRISFLLSFCISFYFSGPARAQLDSAYIYTYGGSNDDYARQIISTRDSGYIVVGTTSSFGVAQTDIYILKTDNNGVKQWSHLYGTPAIDWGYSIRETVDSGYIVTGYTNNNPASGYDVYLLKIDSIGNVEWTNTIGGPDWDFGYGIETTPDSGFIICGKSYSLSNGGSDVYIVKTNSSGAVEWQKHYGGTNDESANGIIRDRNNNYGIVGQTRSFGAGDDDIWILKIDLNGDTLWTRTFGNTKFDAGYAIDTTRDGNFITNGTTRSFSPDSSADMMLIKTRTDGYWLWTRIHGDVPMTDDEEGRVVKQLPNGDIFDGGTTTAYGLGKTAYYMLRNDSAGNFLKGCAFGGTDYEEGYSVAVGKDSQILFAGISDSYGCGLNDMYLIRIDTFAFDNDYVLGINETCDSTIGLNEIMIQVNGMSLFPNPASGTVMVDAIDSKYFSNDITLKISDLAGKELQIFTVDEFPVEVRLDGLLPGIYLVSYHHEGLLLSTGKLMVY